MAVFEYACTVRKAVEPVIAKVCCHQRDDPRPRIVPRQLVDSEAVVNPRVRRELDAPEEQSAIIEYWTPYQQWLL